MSDSTNPCVLALGMFDGMHLGHRKVIQSAVELARKTGAECVVYTFSNHPRSVFAEAPAPLMDNDERTRIMHELGADRVDMAVFDREFAALTPEQFIEMLTRTYNVWAAVAGSDYTFGAKGEGDIEALKRLGGEFGFDVVEVPLVMLESEKVSSTRIREALNAGNRDIAEKMLGRL